MPNVSKQNRDISKIAVGDAKERATSKPQGAKGLRLRFLKVIRYL